MTKKPDKLSWAFVEKVCNEKHELQAEVARLKAENDDMYRDIPKIKEAAERRGAESIAKIFIRDWTKSEAKQREWLKTYIQQWKRENAK